ncbi:MAG TPA: zinc metallopeptidase [Candidatus Onthocola gallistercoris]|uniref:Zinc metallopeptidase n=1 Tax=Candidatus Onthocola gallistercoris TaxID=2840876 RepID=A0A9D1HDS8_9FIRM|nr:zinc metallopeptidase [Candidatus Onthocola gallistercoris]
MYPGFYYMFDPTYILIIIGALLSLFASARVRSTFSRYSSVRTLRGVTGAEAADMILRQAGIYDVKIQHISGDLTDHYDPSSKVLRLSDSVYGSTSVAAVGVAAHECGHAIQDAEGYAPLRIRGSLVPVCNIGATLSWPLIILGVILSWNQTLIQIGIILFTVVVAFHLITLPVELNASSRALKILSYTGILHGDENDEAKKVLSAAALTYVASAAGMILQLLRLVILFGGRRDD